MARGTGARPTKSATPARKAAPKPEQRELEPPAAPATPARAVHRAGGHVDRGDGRGWVIEEE